MCDVRHFSRLLTRAPRSDRLVLLITFGLTVFVDLVVAVNVGVVIAALLFMRRMAESVSVQQEVFGGPEGRAGEGEAAREAALPPNVLVYRIDGPFLRRGGETREHDRAGAAARRDRGDPPRPRAVHGRDRNAHAFGDHRAIPAARHTRRAVRIQDRLSRSLERAGILALVGPDNVCADMAEVAVRVTPA